MEGCQGLLEVQGDPCHDRRRWQLISLALHQTSSEQIYTSYKHGHQDVLICSFIRSFNNQQLSTMCQAQCSML